MVPETNEKFPHAGQSFVAHYGEGLSFLNAYSGDGQLVSVEFLDGDSAGKTATMPFTWARLGDGTYLLSWQEEDRSTVVHCDNFETGASRSFYTVMDGSFFRLSGQITKK